MVTVRNENSLIPHRGDLSPYLLTFQRRREEAAFANPTEETVWVSLGAVNMEEIL